MPTTPSTSPSKEPRMVQVTAPCDMQAGYRFMATSDQADQASFSVTVPPGGVKEGQVFSVPYCHDTTATEVTPFFLHGTVARPPPLGEWNDSLWDCLAWGPGHPSFLNAFCCPQILMAQILTRYQRNWWGSPAPLAQRRRTFAIVASFVKVYWVITLTCSSAPWEDQPLRFVLLQVVSWSMALYTLFVLTRLRGIIRRHHAIPEAFVGQDFCLSFWCGWCSVAQMARQSGDYEHQAAVCCSPTGLGELHEAVLTV